MSCSTGSSDPKISPVPTHNVTEIRSQTFNNLGDFKSAVANIQVHSDPTLVCNQPVFTGIMAALTGNSQPPLDSNVTSIFKRNSQLIVFTDAPPLDASLFNLVVDVAYAAGVQISFIIGQTPECANLQIKYGAADETDAFATFFRMAQLTGGQAIVVTPSEAPQPPLFSVVPNVISTVIGNENRQVQMAVWGADGSADTVMNPPSFYFGTDSRQMTINVVAMKATSPPSRPKPLSVQKNGAGQ